MGRFSKIRSDPSLRYAICDKCHFKFHIKDLKLVDDAYNRLNGLLVCKSCYSPTNPQDTPITLKEKLVTNVKKMRPRQPAVSEINPLDDRVPSKVGHGLARKNPLADAIDLYWAPPHDVGSSSIIGYKILVSVPQFIYYEVLVENTNYPAPYFLDTVTPLTANATYRIAAYNFFGMGEYSDEIYWPYKVVDGINIGERYLMSEPQKLYVVTGDGRPIKINL